MNSFRTLSPLIGTIIIVFALFRLTLSWALHRKIKASRRWLEATGTVTNAKLDSLPRKGGGEHSLTICNYSYNVHGIEYSGKFKVDTFLGSNISSAKNIQKFHPGYIFPVHYNPHKPQEVITEYDGNDPVKLFVSIIAILLGVSLFFLK